GANLSYETLYEVLKRCGFDVKGDKTNFSFIGANGASYSISRSYVVKKEKTSDVYYYVKNGKRVNMLLTYGYNNFFMEKEFNEITGMVLAEVNK
ncbi:MAG: hypothetical protein PHI32_14805, partial [Dysgonamonadaceae bacterium]|nr:hypothetical protein [Dysgonamonadaceae bacterium]